MPCLPHLDWSYLWPRQSSRMWVWHVTYILIRQSICQRRRSVVCFYPDMLQRIGLSANSVVVSLQRVWKSSYLNTCTKIHHRQASVMLVLLYGAETCHGRFCQWIWGHWMHFMWNVSNRYLISSVVSMSSHQCRIASKIRSATCLWASAPTSYVLVWLCSLEQVHLLGDSVV